MGTSVAVIETQLNQQVMPRISNILMASPEVPSAAFQAAFMESMIRNPKLQDCTLPSILLAASTLGCIGVMPGPFTGQAWLIPRKLKGVLMCVAQLGYKGAVSIAARSGRSIEAGVIRKADKYRIIQGSNPEIFIEPNLDNSDSAIIAAWSVQEYQGRRVSPMVVPLKEILAIKSKSAKGSNTGDEEKDGFSPWNDPNVGFPAMCQKTAILRQRRQMPFGMFHMAGAMDDLHTMGRGAWIAPSERTGQPTIITDVGEEVDVPRTITGKDEPLPAHLNRVDFKHITGFAKDGTPQVRESPTIESWMNDFRFTIGKVPPAFIAKVRAVNAEFLHAIAEAGYVDEAATITKELDEKEKQA